MAKLFNTRELFYRYKWLGTLRMNFFVWWCNHGTAFFDRSYRRVRLVSPGAQPFVDDVTKPVIFAMYHGSMIAMLGLHPRKRVTILISNSRDGEMIARACFSLGFSSARGSSARGAVKGTLELLEAAKQGQSLAFMVDGPKGPRHEIKPGVIRVASLCGLPIIPLGQAARSSWSMKSWDKFDASSWSSPMVTMFGEPMFVPEDLSDEQCEKLRVELNERMRQMHSSAQQLMSAVAQ
jgi:lysophospholipid acyltransferase (LPLAT)-like uncharacterized protein